MVILTVLSVCVYRSELWEIYW